jgi:hypothetical protein
MSDESRPTSRARPGRTSSSDPRDHPRLLPPPAERVNVHVVRWALEPVEGELWCEHLAGTRGVSRAAPSLLCESCMSHGATWRGLRLCRSCGHVGCCEKSAEGHAERHFRDTGHPMVDALGPHRLWSFCFVDQIRIFASVP